MKSSNPAAANLPAAGFFFARSAVNWFALTIAKPAISFAGKARVFALAAFVYFDRGTSGFIADRQDSRRSAYQ
jgi:hypothetical protein